jgi:bacitracin synthase 3
MKQQENYWLKQFEVEPPVLDLPTDYKRPAQRNFEGYAVYFYIENEKLDQLKAIAPNENATLVMILVAIFNVMLSKLGGLEDITIMTILTGRNYDYLDQIIGMFANTLFLRNYPQRDKTFIEFLREVKADILKVYENQDYQIDALVEKIAPAREPGRKPISDVCFMQDILEEPESQSSEPQIDEPESELSTYMNEWGETLFDLGIIVRGKKGDKTRIAFEYAAQLYKRETIEKYVTYFKHILDLVLKNRDIKIKDIHLTKGLLIAKSDMTDIDFEL